MLLANDGVLPLRAGAAGRPGRPAGRRRRRRCSAATPSRSHVGPQHPDAADRRRRSPPCCEALRRRAGPRSSTCPGCDVDGTDTSGIAGRGRRGPAGPTSASSALGDRAGLFGRGTSGEGCDAEDLRLPGVQGELLEALLATGTPVVLVLLSGRPYALGAVRATGSAAIVQAFFPGEEGGPAVAGVLTGRVNPSGRLPVERAAHAPAASRRPTSRRRSATAPRSASIDPTPLFPFGHGLSYTEFAWTTCTWTVDRRPDGACRAPVEVATDGSVAVSVDGPQHRRPGRRRGRPALPARPGRPGDPAGGAADRLRPGARWSRAGRPGHVRRPGRPGRVHRPATAAGSSSRATWSCGCPHRAPTSATPCPARLVGPERVVDHQRRLTTGVVVVPASAPVGAARVPSSRWRVHRRPGAGSPAPRRSAGGWRSATAHSRPASSRTPAIASSSRPTAS